MNIDINDAVLREIRQNKLAGKYQLANFYDNSTPYSYTAGNNNITFNGGINPQNISDDSYLKNLQIKNNKTIKGNDNFLNRPTKPVNLISGFQVNETRRRKSCNDINDKDYYLLGYRTNSAVIGIQNHINYDTRTGIDSRHVKR